MLLHEWSYSILILSLGSGSLNSHGSVELLKIGVLKISLHFLFFKFVIHEKPRRVNAPTPLLRARFMPPSPNVMVIHITLVSDLFFLLFPELSLRSVSESVLALLTENEVNDR